MFTGQISAHRYSVAPGLKTHVHNWDWDFLLKVEALKQIIHKPLGLSQLLLYEYDSMS